MYTTHVDTVSAFRVQHQCVNIDKGSSLPGRDMFDAIPFLAQRHGIGVYSMWPFHIFIFDVLDIDEKLEIIRRIYKWFYEVVIMPLV